MFYDGGMNNPAEHLPDTSYLSEQDFNTVGEDARYQQEVLERRPTIFFRPGDRTSPSHPNHLQQHSGSALYIGFIKEYGSHATQKPPTFLSPRIPVRIVSQVAKKICDISSAECTLTYRELSTPEKVLAWLQEKYPTTELTLDSTVTVYEISYKPS